MFVLIVLIIYETFTFTRMSTLFTLRSPVNVEHLVNNTDPVYTLQVKY